MTIDKLVKELQLSVLSAAKNLEREFDGVYVSDMLSWVMARAQKGNIWITVQNNINIVAVSSLLELSGIILPEDVQLDDITQQKADEKGVIILSTSLAAYEVCEKLASVLNKKE